MDIKDLLACLSPQTKARIAHELGQFDGTDLPYDPYHQWVEIVIAEGDEIHAFFGHLDLLNHDNLMPTVDPSDARLSLYEYTESVHAQIAGCSFGFYSKLAALMRDADTDNLERLKTCWPRLHADLKARYNAPGGRLPEESC